MNDLALAILIASALATFGMAAWNQHAMAAMDAELRALIGPARVPFEHRVATTGKSDDTIAKARFGQN